jgi:hypothetical protein
MERQHMVDGLISKVVCFQFLTLLLLTDVTIL